MDGQLGLHGENSLAPQLMERFLELGSPGQSKDELETKSKAPFKVCHKLFAVGVHFKCYVLYSSHCLFYHRFVQSRLEE